MKKYDLVELIHAKLEYTKANVKVGDFGVIRSTNLSLKTDTQKNQKI